MVDRRLSSLSSSTFQGWLEDDGEERIRAILEETSPSDGCKVRLVRSGEEDEPLTASRASLSFPFGEGKPYEGHVFRSLSRSHPTMDFASIRSDLHTTRENGDGMRKENRRRDPSKPPPRDLLFEPSHARCFGRRIQASDPNRSFVSLFLSLHNTFLEIGSKPMEKVCKLRWIPSMSTSVRNRPPNSSRTQDEPQEETRNPIWVMPVED